MYWLDFVLFFFWPIFVRFVLLLGLNHLFFQFILSSFVPEIWIDLCFVDYCILVRFGFYLAVFLLDFFSCLWILNSFNSSIKNASKLCTFQVQELIQFSVFLDFHFFFLAPLKQNLSKSRSIPVGLLLVTLNLMLYKSSHFWNFWLDNWMNVNAA